MLPFSLAANLCTVKFAVEAEFKDLMWRRDAVEVWQTGSRAAGQGGRAGRQGPEFRQADLCVALSVNLVCGSLGQS